MKKGVRYLFRRILGVLCLSGRKRYLTPFLVFALTLAQEQALGRARIDVVPREATIGDPLRATLTLDLPAGTKIEPPDLGTSFGPFNVSSGSWSGPAETPGGVRFTWSGVLAAYETGSLEVPALSIQIPGPGGMGVIRTEAVAITIRSVLPAKEKEGGDKPPELSDLKAATSIAPNYGPVKKALGALLGLLVVSGVAWWLGRRYGSRLAAVPAPVDPFRRMPPHAWAYQELQRLLEQRLAEEGRVDVFFSELSRILKLYLGGRYRVDLLEHTTEEVVPLLRQAGAPQGPLLEGRALLERCDLVKFAKQAPSPEACRKAVEEAYRIVDVTKPVEQAQPAARGAA